MNMMNNYCHSIGSPIMSNLDNSGSMVYTELVQQIIEKAKSVVRDLDPFNDLMVFRMRSKKYEIMVAPGKLLNLYFIEVRSCALYY